MTFFSPTQPMVPAPEMDLTGDLAVGGSSASGADPRGAWELARAGYLVELAAAAALHRDLAPAARAFATTLIGSFLDENQIGRAHV